MKKPQSWRLATLGFAFALFAIVLGFWQLGRGQTKDLISEQEAQAQTVILQGQWLPEHTVYLKNRTMQGRTGFLVLTPLLRSLEQDLVLVQRGWMARDRADPYKLQAIETPNGIVQIQGVWSPWPSRYFSLGKDSLTQSIRQNIDPEQFAPLLHEKTSRALHQTATLRELGPPSQGLLRNWDRLANTSAKNYAYALQWFMIALALAGITVWFQWLKPARKTNS